MKPILSYLLLIALAVNLSSCASFTRWWSQNGGKVTCKEFDKAFVKKGITPKLYIKKRGRCTAVPNPDALANGTYYLAGCTKSIPFYGQNFQEYCERNLYPKTSKNSIGNPLEFEHYLPNRSDYATPWTLTQGSRVDAAVINQTRYPRPFSMGVQYKSIQTPQGTCSLEMQIIKQNPRATNLKPMILIHGGGWSNRGAGSTIGIEGTAPNFTRKGYVVFAPFYRLVGHASGPDACQGADGAAIQADLTDALDWVLKHGKEYGVKAGTTKAYVFGQSAGGHLAGYLAVHHRKKIKKAMLLYPATDFSFFIEQSKPGGLYEKGFGPSKSATVQYVDQSGVSDVTKISLNNRIVKQNSFPQIVHKNPAAYPPMFIVQGTADKLAPPEMSTRMCAAYGSAPLPKSPYRGGSKRINCGQGSQLHMIKGAGHSLDIKCFQPLLGKLAQPYLLIDAFCPPGSKKGALEIKRTLQKAYGSFF